MATTVLRKKDLKLLNSHIDIINLQIHPSQTEHQKIVKEIKKLENILVSTPHTNVNQEALTNFAICLAVLTSMYAAKNAAYHKANPTGKTIIGAQIHNISEKEMFSSDAVKYFRIGGLGVGGFGVAGVTILVALLSIPLAFACPMFAAVMILTGFAMMAGKIYNFYKEQQQANLRNSSIYLDAYQTSAQETINALNKKYDTDQPENYYDNNKYNVKGSYNSLFDTMEDLVVEKPEEIQSNFIARLCC